MECRDADEDQVDVNTGKNQLDDGDKRVGNGSEPTQRTIWGHFSEDFRVRVEEVFAVDMTRGYDQSVNIGTCIYG